MAKPPNRPSGPTGPDGREVMIEVEQLSRSYGPMPALRGVSFRAYKGEILGFLGPNGAGKTTAMRIITGYLPPSGGTARVGGFDVVDQSMEARRIIGYLPESTPLYHEMTVSGYLHFMARLRGVAHPAEAVERAMGRVNIDHRADDLIGQLSKGYKQRVGIAQALVHDPAVIILDEPTIGLDPRQIREVRSLISELRGDHTVILSTHILPEAQQVCDRVLIIKRGEIVAEDTPKALAERLTGGEHVKVVVSKDLPSKKVTAALAEVPGVESVQSTGGGVFEVQAARDASPRAALAALVVGQGWPLLELTPMGKTLEDVFLELTAEEVTEDDWSEEEEAVETAEEAA